MEPTPVGINHDATGLLGAAAVGGALLPGQGRVDFFRQRPSLLSANGSDEGGEKEGALMHNEGNQKEWIFLAACCLSCRGDEPNLEGRDALLYTVPEHSVISDGHGPPYGKIQSEAS